MTPTQRKAMEQALKALDDLRGYRQDIDDAIGALVEALAEKPAELRQLTTHSGTSPAPSRPHTT